MIKKLQLMVALLCCSGLSMAQNWTSKADLPAVGRHHPICFSIGDTAYLTTGLGNLNGLSDFYSYDPTTDTWKKKADHPGGIRAFGVGLNHNNKGYVAFGIGPGNAMLNDVWEFDQSTQTWKELASLPGAGRYHPAFVAVNNKLYVGLGSNAGVNLGDWWELDLATNTWSEKATFPGADRHHPYYFSIGDYAYVGLGHGNSVGGNYSIYDDFYRYDPATDTWTQIADLPAYARVAGTCFDYEGNGYILAGQNQVHQTPTTNEFWQYIPSLDTWNQLPDCPSGGRWAPGSFLGDGQVFFGFGENLSFSNENDLWAFDLGVLASVNPIAEDESWKLYPNPAQEEIYLESLTGENLFQTGKITSVSGQLIREFTLENMLTTIDVRHLHPGMYIISLNAKNGEQKQIRFIKQ